MTMMMMTTSSWSLSQSTSLSRRNFSLYGSKHPPTFRCSLASPTHKHNRFSRSGTTRAKLDTSRKITSIQQHAYTIQSIHQLEPVSHQMSNKQGMICRLYWPGVERRHSWHRYHPKRRYFHGRVALQAGSSVQDTTATLASAIVKKYCQP